MTTTSPAHPPKYLFSQSTRACFFGKDNNRFFLLSCSTIKYLFRNRLSLDFFFSPRRLARLERFFFFPRGLRGIFFGEQDSSFFFEPGQRPIVFFDLFGSLLSALDRTPSRNIQKTQVFCWLMRSDATRGTKRTWRFASVFFFLLLWLTWVFAHTSLARQSFFWLSVCLVRDEFGI